MTEPIRWGILGAANFALEQMGPAIHEAEEAVLVALATSDAAKARPFRAFCPDLDVLEDYDALLARDDIDAIYVPLPNHLHVDWTLKALAAGKHVLTEKPIAMQEAEFDRLIDARDDSGLLAAEAYMIVHHPQWQRARSLVRDGAIGDLVSVDGVFSYDNRSEPDNIRNRAETGGGGLRDIGVYTFGSARFVTGQEPDSVRAEIDWENGVDVFARVNASFPGFRYSMATSMRMTPRQEMTFQGTDGFLTLDAPFNARLYGEARVHLRRGSVSTIERFTAANHYRLQVEAFGRSIRDGVDYPCPLEFSRGTQRMIDMAFAAADPPP